jgi:hypothetical protein
MIRRCADANPADRHPSALLSIVAEWLLNSLPDARTRHNRKSKPSAGSYLRVCRLVDKEDFTLNSALLCGRGRDTCSPSRPGTLSFTALKGLFPMGTQCMPTTFDLSPVKYNNTNEPELPGGCVTRVTRVRPISLGRRLDSNGNPAHFLIVARIPRVPCKVFSQAGWHAGVLG